MVDPELGLEPVDRARLVNGHKPSIVDQQVQPVALVPEVGGNVATEARSARSSGMKRTFATGASLLIEVTADCAFPVLRQARTTSAPATASAAAT